MPSVYASIAARRRPRVGGAELELARVVEPEQLVRVAVLLVVVDQARIRRRRDDAVERRARNRRPRVALEDVALRARVAHSRERLDARERVERVAAEEADGGLDGWHIRCACGTSTRRSAARSAPRDRSARRAAPSGRLARGSRGERRGARTRRRDRGSEELRRAPRRVPVGARTRSLRDAFVGSESSRAQRIAQLAPSASTSYAPS